MGNEDPISLSELDEAEKEVLEAMEWDLDDDDAEDFEKVEELTLPLVKERIYDGLPIHGLAVPVIKEDDFITDQMYRMDIDFGPTKDPPPHVFDLDPNLPARVCSICFGSWNGLHQYCCLPCGHIFGFECIEKWLKTNLRRKCPDCNVSCSLEDVKTLSLTLLRIPAADKGVADQEVYARHFPFTKEGLLKYRKFEIGRRNFALKKRSDAKKRLAGVVGRKNNFLKRQADLLELRASVLNRAKKLENWGGSSRQADALRLRAGALGRWADEYLRRAEACEERDKALSERVRAYDLRVNAFKERLKYFAQSLQDTLQDNTTHCAAAATCHKDVLTYMRLLDLF